MSWNARYANEKLAGNPLDETSGNTNPEGHDVEAGQAVNGRSSEERQELADKARKTFF
jgi:hypothetical protein